MRTVVLVAIAAMIGFAGVYGLARPGALAVPFATSNCVIKGNISYNSGERIYHMPGQRYYDATIISPEKGERWFCTEAEAVAAGWRKAGD